MPVPNEAIVPPLSPPPVDTPPRDPDRIPGDEPPPDPEPDEGAAPRARIWTHAPDHMNKVHPLGKSPIVEDVDDLGRRIVLVETGVICHYLVDKAGGRLGPATPLDRMRYRQFLHYAEGSVMPVLFAALVVSKVPLLGGFAERKVRRMLDVHLAYIEQELASRPWFAGDEMTAADTMMSVPLEAASARGV